MFRTPARPSWPVTTWPSPTASTCCLVVRRRITFLAKAEYFTGTGLKGWFTRWFYTAAGQVPIDRTDADSAQNALDTAERILDEGKLLGMYPEGTRSPDGRLYKGKTGLARLALQTGVPVIPVAMIGTDVGQPAGQQDVAVRPGRRSSSASRWTSAGSRAWPATGSSSGP